MEVLFSSEVAVVTVCGLAALLVLVFLSLVVLASFDVIDGKFLLELIRAFHK
ncbi:transporter [Mitsuokella jalaludinii]|uniref:transporter n=1 Tax=Mitsuokella jalaludinii TaxID=187979 RepID=UPI003F89A5B3